MSGDSRRTFGPEYAVKIVTEFARNVPLMAGKVSQRPGSEHDACIAELEANIMVSLARMCPALPPAEVRGHAAFLGALIRRTVLEYAMIWDREPGGSVH